MSYPPRRLIVLAVALALPSLVQAELIFLKDGFVLQGKVRRESVVEFDPVTKEMISIPRGFFMVDDGVRRVYFSPRQVSIVERLSTPPEETIGVGRVLTLINPKAMLPVEEVIEAGPWNPKTWTRPYQFKAPPRGPADPAVWGVTQMIARINPYYVQVDAVNKFKWHSGYLTREFDPNELYALLKAGKAFQETAEMKPQEIVAKRMRLINFLTQTGWYDLAEKELDKLLTDLPSERTRVTDARAVIDKQRAKDRWETIKTLFAAGRFQATAKEIDNFPLRNASDKVLADLRELKTRLATQAETLKEAKTALGDWAKKVNTPAGKELVRIVGVIEKELHPATVDRLDAFLGQAREADRRIAKGEKPPYNPEELLSLAVSGFLLGSPSAAPKPEIAINLWKTRVFLLEYLREPLKNARDKRLADYEKDVTPRVDLDEIAQMVDFLPPTESVDVQPSVPTEMKCGPRQRLTYEVVLPPEYTPNRQYPVLLALPAAGERASAMTKRLQATAAEQGYILASVEWGRGEQRWNYSAENHDAVLECLRDLRRKFQMDSDRVFLIGLADGGKGVYDVGLSHPDLFAGLIPMAGGPHVHARRYWRNAQYLPVYAVTGTTINGDQARDTREQFTQWVGRGYPAFWVEYKGRGTEWYPGELPLVFDWMRNQKRAFPLRRLGTDGAGGTFGDEFCSIRRDDNRFYWVTGTTVRQCQMPADRWSNAVPSAMITATVNTEGNGVAIKSSGYSQITLWIGRNSAGKYMLDLDRPVTVRHGLNTVVLNNKKITPSLGVLVEDLFERGDRKHLFVAKVPFKVN
jgi:predicted esterase